MSMILDVITNEVEGEYIESQLFYVVNPLVVDGKSFLLQMYAQACMAIEAGFGTLFILREKVSEDSARYLGGAVVLHKEESEVGANHLHILTIHPSAQGRGLGRTLVKEVLDWFDGDPISLECKHDVEPFFRKLGFATRKKNPSERYVSMYANGPENLLTFYKPMMTEPTIRYYNSILNQQFDALKN